MNDKYKTLVRKLERNRAVGSVWAEYGVIAD
jgi:hypothetical protein